MDGKNKKKSKQDLINSAMGELTKPDDPSGIKGPLMIRPGKDDKIVKSLISPDADRSHYHETLIMPEGLEDDNGMLRKKQPAAPTVVAQSSGDETDLIHQKTGTAYQEQTNYGTYATNATSATSAMPASSSSSGDENTVVVGKGARAKIPEAPAEDKTSFGLARPSTRTLGSPTASESDAQVNKAENLRIAQERLTDLEQELERLRGENEQLASANAAAKDQLFEVSQKVMRLEQEINNNLKHYQSEVGIFRDSASLKEVELIKSRSKIDDLQSRLNVDLRKIRVRERELENRLELTRMEKEALLRAKDDAILDLKRKLSNVTHEMDGYRQKINDLNARLESNNEQFSRTVRTLRLALTNLEANNDSTPAVRPTLKKAE